MERAIATTDKRFTLKTIRFIIGSMGIKASSGEPFIKLDQFLKWQQIAQSGGEAKMLIHNGEVEVNGEMELRRGRKLFAGDVVTVDELSFEVHSSTEAE
ncbi:MAG: RNA-binding S4 domain-containing protein [Cyanobacteria bacterium P01_D01_bin.115]